MVYSLKDKTILLTGGTGSFGQKFSEVVLQDHSPRSIRVYSRGELMQLQMDQKFHNENLRFFIGDVRDKNRLNRAMKDVDLVVHAAALKQVPACEYNPIEAIKTNIDGTVNIIDAALDNEVERVMLISTDKAVHPVNLYGATKMVAEKLIVQANSYAGGGKTRFSCVRYGNVIGSRGSVVPLFLEQRKTGTITVTDERMTRFWLTLEQGVRFVIQCIQQMEGGETFVPKIPSMTLVELAKAIAPDAKIKNIGIRPGEKLHEILLTEDESRHTTEYDTCFVVEPEYISWPRTSIPGGKKAPENFRYTSDTNKIWLTREDLIRLAGI